MVLVCMPSRLATISWSYQRGARCNNGKKRSGLLSPTSVKLEFSGFRRSTEVKKSTRRIRRLASGIPALLHS